MTQTALRDRLLESEWNLCAGLLALIRTWLMVARTRQFPAFYPASTETRLWATCVNVRTCVSWLHNLLGDNGDLRESCARVLVAQISDDLQTCPARVVEAFFDDFNTIRTHQPLSAEQRQWLAAELDVDLQPGLSTELYDLLVVHLSGLFEDLGI